MAIRFQIRRKENAWAPAEGLEFERAVNKFRSILRNQDPLYRLKRPGSTTYGPPRSLRKTMDIIISRLPVVEVGSVFKVRTADGTGPIFAIRKVNIGLPEANPSFDVSGGSEDVQRVARVASAFDPNVKSLGILVKKRVKGTSVWSQHSPWPKLNCKANAIDFGFDNNLSRQKAMAAYLVRNAAELNINKVISETTYWSKENNFEPRYYSGVAHATHIHVDMYPNQTGDPC